MKTMETGGGVKQAAPQRITTTWYALIAALQTVVGPAAAALVVATVLHWVRVGQLTSGGERGQDRRDWLRHMPTTAKTLGTLGSVSSE